MKVEHVDVHVVVAPTGTLLACVRVFLGDASDSLMLSGIKIYKSPERGLTVDYPRGDGFAEGHTTPFFPTTKSLRDKIERAVLAAYAKHIEKGEQE